MILNPAVMPQLGEDPTGSDDDGDQLGSGVEEEGSELPDPIGGDTAFEEVATDLPDPDTVQEEEERRKEEEEEERRKEEEREEREEEKEEEDTVRLLEKEVLIDTSIKNARIYVTVTPPDLLDTVRK